MGTYNIKNKQTRSIPMFSIEIIKTFNNKQKIIYEINKLLIIKIKPSCSTKNIP